MYMHLHYRKARKVHMISQLISCFSYVFVIFISCCTYTVYKSNISGVVQSSHRKKGPGLNSTAGALLCGAYMWSLYFSYLPRSKDMHIQMIGGSKWTLDVRVDGHLSCLSLCGPVRSWQYVHCTLPLS